MATVSDLLVTVVQMEIILDILHKVWAPTKDLEELLSYVTKEVEHIKSESFALFEKNGPHREFRA